MARARRPGSAEHPVPQASVPPRQMTAGALARYRGQLERRLRVCKDDARRTVLQAGLAAVLAEDAERRRLARAADSEPG